MAVVSEEARIRAEAKFAKAQKAAQASKEAWTDHEAEAVAVRTRTTRLRALRLAKEAANMQAKVDAKKKPIR